MGLAGPAVPLLGCCVSAFGFKILKGRTAGWIGTGAIFLSFLSALGALFTLLDRAPDARHVSSSLWDYAVTSGLSVKLSIFVDPLSVFMILVVSGVSTLIHLYSISYLTGDRGFTATSRT